MMSVVRWTFTDGATTVELPINPESMTGSLFQDAAVTTLFTLTGRTLVTEGAPTAGTIGFEGTILTQAHYELMYDWRPSGIHGRRRITITDHLGRLITGIITSWQPVPVRSGQHPWRHRYQASFLVLQVVNP